MAHVAIITMGIAALCYAHIATFLPESLSRSILHQDSKTEFGDLRRGEQVVFQQGGSLTAIATSLKSALNDQ